MAQISREQFEAYIEEGIASLPDWVKEKLDNVAFLLEDAPEQEQYAELGLEENGLLFGLYEGVPLTERSVNDGVRFPDTITLFKDHICAAYEEPEDVRACVVNTIWHEVAHYFGHDEEWIEREERRRGKDK